MRADRAVEPTKSENITVTWRRSARSSGEASCYWSDRWRRRLRARIGTQRGDGVEELAAMPDDADAKILQVFRRQARQDRLVNLVLAERSLILSEAKAPQPDHDVHDGARASPWSIASLDGPGEVLGGVGVRRVREGARGCYRWRKATAGSRALWTSGFPRFTTPAEVIRRSRGFISF